jgi:hypothetical protein
MIDVRSVIRSPRRGASGCHLAAVGCAASSLQDFTEAPSGTTVQTPQFEVSPRRTGLGKLIGAPILPGRWVMRLLRHGLTRRRGSARRAGTVPPMVEHQRVITDLIAPIRADWAAVPDDAG